MRIKVCPRAAPCKAGIRKKKRGGGGGPPESWMKIKLVACLLQPKLAFRNAPCEFWVFFFFSSLISAYILTPAFADNDAVCQHLFERLQIKFSSNTPWSLSFWWDGALKFVLKKAELCWNIGNRKQLNAVRLANDGGTTADLQWISNHYQCIIYFFSEHVAFLLHRCLFKCLWILNCERNW